MLKISKVGIVAGTALVCGLGALSTAIAQDEDTTTIITRHEHIRMPGDRDIRVMVNHQPVDFNGPGPIMVGGDHVFVPLRGVFEQMGGYVQWHPDDQVIHGFRSGGHEFRVQIGSTDATVNGAQETLDTPPMLRDGTTYVPLRFASEALGARVHWHPDTSTVSISTHDSDDNF